MHGIRRCNISDGAALNVTRDVIRLGEDAKFVRRSNVDGFFREK